jgi:hypothetical protein
MESPFFQDGLTFFAFSFFHPAPVVLVGILWLSMPPRYRAAKGILLSPFTAQNKEVPYV